MVVMKWLFAFAFAVVLGPPVLCVQTTPRNGERQAPAADEDVVREGELETFVAIGGESTGWRLRTRTDEGRRRFIELLVTPEMAQGLRAGTRVQVRGTMKTRHYVERGDVPVLVVRSVIAIARR
jgi:hypothetical protein